AHLYRIAREAVINANKHAHAREIVVKLQRSGQGMVLRVTDNGVGLSSEFKTKQELGFHIMNYRTQLLGGRIEVDSSERGDSRESCFCQITRLARQNHAEEKTARNRDPRESYKGAKR